MERPEFAIHCAVWDTMDNDDIRNLIRKRPELKPNFSEERLGRLDEDEDSDDDSGDSESSDAVFRGGAIISAREFFGGV